MDDPRKKSHMEEYNPETAGGSDTPPEAGMEEMEAKKDDDQGKYPHGFGGGSGEATPDRTPESDEKMPGYYGHPRFKQMSEEEVELHDRKNHDYAAGGNPLGNFYRVSTILGLYPGLDPSNPAVIALIFAMKQLDAVLWSHSNKHEAVVEGRMDKLKDLSIYYKLSRILEEENFERELAQIREDLREMGVEHIEPLKKGDIPYEHQ